MWAALIDGHAVPAQFSPPQISHSLPVQAWATLYLPQRPENDISAQCGPAPDPMPTSGAVSVGHGGLAGSPRPVERASWAKPRMPTTPRTTTTAPKRLERAGAGLDAWSGHL